VAAAAAGGGAAPGFSVSQAGHLMVSAELRQKQPEHSHEPSLGLKRSPKPLTAPPVGAVAPPVGADFSRAAIDFAYGKKIG